MFANCALLLNKYNLLFKQNNKKTIEQLIKLIVTSNTKVIIYNNIIKIQRRRNIKEAIIPNKKRRECKDLNVTIVSNRNLQEKELKYSIRKIKTLKLKKYCLVLLL